MSKPTFTIAITGNWCDGFYWQLVSVATGGRLAVSRHEDGPYHGTRLENPRAVAWDDAKDYADRNDLELAGCSYNPHWNYMRTTGQRY